MREIDAAESLSAISFQFSELTAPHRGRLRRIISYIEIVRIVIDKASDWGVL